MIAYQLADSVLFHGTRIRANVTFDNVLRFYDLQADEDLTDSDKVELALEMLIVPADFQEVKRAAPAGKVEILKTIFDQLITIKSKRPGSTAERLLDFTQDASFLYSSFLMDYGIDLIEQQGKLDWRKFIALLQGLSERTKMREVMAIRSRKIPSLTKSNADEIKALTEAKAYYALEISADEARDNFQKGLDRFGASLERMASNGKG